MEVDRDRCLEHGHATELELLADDSGQIGDGLVDRAPVGHRLLRQCGLIAHLQLSCRAHDRACERLEVLALGDEVGLAKQLDHDVVLRHHEPVGGCALSTALGGLRGTRDPQALNGLVDVPVGFLQGLLALHHARAREVAKLLDIGCRDRGHDLSL